METNIQPGAPMAGGLPPTIVSPMSQTGVPIGAKIIAILHYLVSIFFIFAGIMLAFVGAWTLSSVAEFFGLGFGLGTSIIPGLLAIAWGLVHFATGRGLWMGKEWGQVLAITVSGLYIAVGVINLVIFGGGNYLTYTGFALHLAIILYLLLNKKIHTAFPYGSSGNTGVILAIVAIVIYGTISTMSIIYKNKLNKLGREFTTGLKERIERTNKAVEQSGMDCKFYEYKSYDDKYKPLSTQTGSGIYTNALFNFQMDIGQSYEVQEQRGTNYCEHEYVFYKPGSTALTGRLVSISIQPAKGDLDYIYNDEYKYEQNVQKSNTQIAGQPAFKIVHYTITTYLFVRQGKLFDITYQIPQVNPVLTDEQFDAIVSSFQLTK